MGVLEGAGTGAAIGSVIPGIGTAAGAIAGGIIGLGQTIGGWISGKDKEEKQRPVGLHKLRKSKTTYKKRRTKCSNECRSCQ